MAHGDITHVEIPVSDFARATTFYSDLFGWKIATIPGFETYPMWQAPNKISGGALTPCTEDFTEPRTFVEVDSIDETLEKATAAGATVVTPRSPIDEKSWWALITDPDGNHIGLYEGDVS